MAYTAKVLEVIHEEVVTHRGNQHLLRVTKDEIGNQTKVQIRLWYLNEGGDYKYEDETYSPGRDGLTLPVSVVAALGAKLAKVKAAK